MRGISRNFRKDENFISVDIVDVIEKVEQVGLKILGVDLWVVEYSEPFITSIYGPKQFFVRIVPVRSVKDPNA